MSFAVLRVTGSVARLGLVLAVQSGVAILLTLAGGLAGDRFPRRRIPVRRPAHATRPTIVRQLRIGWAEFAKRRWLWLPTLEWTMFSLVIPGSGECSRTRHRAALPGRPVGLGHDRQLPGARRPSRPDRCRAGP
jgi:hypothetical protein